MSGRAAGVRAAVRDQLMKRAHDVTDGSRRSVLVIAPHPDDETLGCGSLILRARRSGARVTLVVATDGAVSHETDDAISLAARRSAELAAAATLLGVPAADVIELRYPDGELSMHRNGFADELVKLIQQRRPDDVYTTCQADWHPDHRAAAIAARDAVARCDPAPRLLEYPIWLWTDWPVSRRYRNGRGLLRALRILIGAEVEKVRIAELREQKRQALQAYASQLGDEDALPAEVIDRALTGPELFFRLPPG
ncbi:LmbE family N-acetylglucosaminyl deacetylase [Jatrophihabitans sp. GAS493]|uniref:PIG-L deacetylase family protein n=1 Tax=Jatrophihabitans sp. GAS493 TaxID=1907575 RepID=UPI000BB7F4A8|nr:PIG-L deacetylase family protein [Jatrophihabitans sp. GAS493]SOD70305.1 LmbE family N-acetylglucosaminyl deacetylase [Jatrophihabitans sp. GAS493]